MFAHYYLLLIFCTVSWSLEPECPFGSPRTYLEDAEKRCDRYWDCEDGIITDFYCSMGSGFDPETQKCHTSAPCLTSNETVTTTRPIGGPLAGFIDLLSTSSARIPVPVLNQTVEVGSKFLTPILESVRGFFTP